MINNKTADDSSLFFFCLFAATRFCLAHLPAKLISLAKFKRIKFETVYAIHGNILLPCAQPNSRRLGKLPHCSIELRRVRTPHGKPLIIMPCNNLGVDSALVALCILIFHCRPYKTSQLYAGTIKGEKTIGSICGDI